MTAADSVSTARHRPVALPIAPRKHPGRWIAIAITVILAIMLVNTLATNPRYQWDIVARYFTSTQVLSGLLRTLQLTVICMAIGIVIGSVVAVMKLSPNKLLSGAATLYVFIFRGTPMLVQLLLWFNLSALYPKLGIGLPFGPPLFEADTNSLITTFTAAILGLALHEGAYMAEVMRGGILSVGAGQREAAEALGLPKSLVFRRIVLPQAMSVILPPTGNNTIQLLKASAQVSVISMADLLYTTQIISARTFQVIPLLLVATIWYLIVVAILSFGQHFLEKRFGRHTSGPVTAVRPRKDKTPVAAVAPLSIARPKE